MAKFTYVAGRLTYGQIAAAAIPQSIDPFQYLSSNRILLMGAAQSAAFVGGGPTCSAAQNSAAIPVGTYLELWTQDPYSVFIVGTGTVYYIVEEIEGPH